MAWAALLIGLVTGLAIFVGTVAMRRPRFRVRERRAHHTAPTIDPTRLRTCRELRDELLLRAKLARNLSSAPEHDGEHDATLDEFQRASEAFLQLAARGASQPGAHRKNGGRATS
jgi:hypothetical protein